MFFQIRQARKLNANVRFADYQNFSVTLYDQSGNSLQYQNFIDVWSRKITVDVNKFQDRIILFKSDHRQRNRHKEDRN